MYMYSVHAFVHVHVWGQGEHGTIYIMYSVCVHRCMVEVQVMRFKSYLVGEGESHANFYPGLSLTGQIHIHNLEMAHVHCHVSYLCTYSVRIHVQGTCTCIASSQGQSQFFNVAHRKSGEGLVCTSCSVTITP